MANGNARSAGTLFELRRGEKARSIAWHPLRIFIARPERVEAHQRIGVRHPFCRGSPTRRLEIVKLIGDMLEKGGVWLAPMQAIAAHVKTCIDNGTSPDVAGERAVADLYGSKNSSARVSMLSRGGASAGVVGSSKPVCSENRARPSVAESKHLISTASSARIFGK